MSTVCDQRIPVIEPFLMKHETDLLLQFHLIGTVLLLLYRNRSIVLIKSRHNV